MTVNYTGGGRSTHRRKAVRRAIDVTGTPSYQTTSASRSVGARLAPLRAKAVPPWAARASLGLARESARPTFDFQYVQEAEGSTSGRYEDIGGRSSVWEDPRQQHLASRAAHNEDEQDVQVDEERRRRVLQQRNWLNLGQPAGNVRFERPQARQPRTDVYLTGERSVSPPEEAMLRGSSVFPEEPSSPATHSIRLSSSLSETRSVEGTIRKDGTATGKSATPPRTDAFSAAFNLISPQKRPRGANHARSPSVDYSALPHHSNPASSTLTKPKPEELKRDDKTGLARQVDHFLAGMADQLKLGSSPAAAVAPATRQPNSPDLLDFPSSAPEPPASSASPASWSHSFPDEVSRRSSIEIVPETPEESQTAPEEELPALNEPDLPKPPKTFDYPAAPAALSEPTVHSQASVGEQQGDVGDQLLESRSHPSLFLDLSLYTWPPASPPRHLRHLHEPSTHHLPDKLQESDLKEAYDIILVHERLGLGCQSIDPAKAREMLSREFAMRHSGIEPLEWGWESDGEDDQVSCEEGELDDDEPDEGYISEQAIIKAVSPHKSEPPPSLPDGMIFDPFDETGILEP